MYVRMPLYARRTRHTRRNPAQPGTPGATRHNPADPGTPSRSQLCVLQHFSSIFIMVKKRPRLHRGQKMKTLSIYHTCHPYILDSSWHQSKTWMLSHAAECGIMCPVPSCACIWSWPERMPLDYWSSEASLCHPHTISYVFILIPSHTCQCDLSTIKAVCFHKSSDVFRVWKNQ